MKTVQANVSLRVGIDCLLAPFGGERTFDLFGVKGKINKINTAILAHSGIRTSSFVV